jgi:hypothetical protein
MSNHRAWVSALVSLSAFLGIAACQVDNGPRENVAKSEQALVAPAAVDGFALLASGRITIQDRTQVTGGDVGAAATTGDAINTATDVRLAVGRGSIGSRIVLGDRTQVGDVRTSP